MQFRIRPVVSLPILCPLLLPTLCSAQQSQPSPPSKGEISELLAKADEKVGSYVEAVKAVKLDVEKQEPQLFKNDLNAATTARTLIGLIRSTQSNGSSAYALVALMTALDDITLNAAKTAMVVLARPRWKSD